MRKDKDPHYDACHHLFDDLHGGKRTVAVSALVVGEVIPVTRREAARAAGKVHASNVAHLPTAREMADEAVGTFFQQTGGCTTQTASQLDALQCLRDSNHV